MPGGTCLSAHKLGWRAHEEPGVSGGDGGGFGVG